MKSKRITHLVILALLAFLTSVSSEAATQPLSYPYGLALDSSGNLYVANTSGNDVLVYNPSHVQTRSLIQGIAGPTGVAIDPSGNLWVANAPTNSITSYSPAGDQVTSATITSGVNNPQAIAVDGLGDVWIENNFYLVGIWPHALQGEPLSTGTLGGVALTGVAVYKDLFVVGSNNNSMLGESLSDHPKPASDYHLKTGQRE
ncbi:MAG: hypothetical protein WAL71_06530 [Terriglobales bacterium]